MTLLLLGGVLLFFPLPVLLWTALLKLSIQFPWCKTQEIKLRILGFQPLWSRGDIVLSSLSCWDIVVSCFKNFRALLRVLSITLYMTKLIIWRNNLDQIMMFSINVNKRESQLKSSAYAVASVTLISPVFTLCRCILYWRSPTLFWKVLSWLYWCDFTVKLLNIITFYKGLYKSQTNEFFLTALVAW